MDEKKKIFVSFAKEDTRQRNMLKEHPLMVAPHFELVDFAVKEVQSNDWKDRVLLAMRRCRGVIVLVSERTLVSGGQRWELSCAKAEKKPIYAVWAYLNDRTPLPGIAVVPWSWDELRGFIDTL